MVTFVVSGGNVPIDIYSQKVAEYLPVPKLYTDYFQKVAVKLAIRQKYHYPSIATPILDARLLKTLRRTKGVLHFPHQHFGRFGYFLSTPFIITCHDIIRYLDIHEKETLHKHPNFKGRFYLSLDFSGLRKASKIIAISENTKRDLISRLDIKEQNIDVVYPGIDHSIFYPSKNISLETSPYILYVGSETPRKNLSLLLEAFKKLKQNKRFKGLKLIKVGNAGGTDATTFRAATINRIISLGLEKDVIFMGYLSEKTLSQYYSMAQCLVFPSFYEGFGIPPLEAMACGCPVIVSDRTSLPEVIGSAGLNIDPTKVDELTDTLIHLLTTSKLRQDLISRGLKRAQLFSWEKTATQIYKIYQQEGYL